MLVVADMETLEARGRQRWVDHACTEEVIRARLDDNDMPNVRLVYERGAEPDRIIRT